jgi:hypothetical protein
LDKSRYARIKQSAKAALFLAKQARLVGSAALIGFTKNTVISLKQLAGEPFDFVCLVKDADVYRIKKKILI